MAALFLRGPSSWPPMQLEAALILPPTNHCANGSFQTRTLSQRLNQVSESARSAQNPSGSALARAQSFSYSSRLLMCACWEKSAVGGNLRVSFNTLVMFGVVMVVGPWSS